MISNLFKKNNIEDFIEDDIQIEIENPNKNSLEVSNIGPDLLVRDYESIKILSMNPQSKKEIMDLIEQSKEDLHKIYRLLNVF